MNRIQVPLNPKLKLSVCELLLPSDKTIGSNI